ncbi:hypothetical protein AAFF_G00347890 [Aldrovandia affinis]|uniref:Uncharacterized protein n=1 Tax=Aldrovandia affinis TaxID=143900 RepID=A0AAD7SJT5_9TELE|nr:hypothetical protein AAFF_G00347890 [Aldrovandia affinis]
MAIHRGQILKSPAPRQRGQNDNETAQDKPPPSGQKAPEIRPLSAERRHTAPRQNVSELGQRHWLPLSSSDSQKSHLTGPPRPRQEEDEFGFPDAVPAVSPETPPRLRPRAQDRAVSESLITLTVDPGIE